MVKHTNSEKKWIISQLYMNFCLLKLLLLITFNLSTCLRNVFIPVTCLSINSTCKRSTTNLLKQTS